MTRAVMEKQGKPHFLISAHNETSSSFLLRELERL